MGKLTCDSTTSSPVIPWRDPTSTPSLDPPASPKTTTSSSWDGVSGLEDQQKRHLNRLQARGVLWKHPKDQSKSLVFRLSHGGEVDADGNCLFTATRKAMGSALTAWELRRRAVRRFLADFGMVGHELRERTESLIRHLYYPDLNSGWGIHVIQEVKLLATKEDRLGLDSAINELLQLGMQRESAAESIYRERCIAVDDGPSWAKYMSISGSLADEYDIITLQYTEEGLLSVDENRDGHAAAFGDDIAIECLATEFKREIFVVQAHGSDAMVDEDSCVFFLPHSPNSEICEPPLFLLMKGTGWCGAGGDHYEPLVAQTSSFVSQEKRGVCYPSLRLSCSPDCDSLNSVLKKYPPKFVGCCLANPTEGGKGVEEFENLILKMTNGIGKAIFSKAGELGAPVGFMCMKVYVIFSALLRVSRAPYPYDDLSKALALVVSSFGANHVMWGSDVPCVVPECG